MEFFAQVWFSEPRVTLLLAAAFLLLAILLPRRSERFFLRIEAFFSALAARKLLAILLLFLSVIVVRLALLGWLPIPNPGIHDEFSYLLMADTFAHGRLTNPTHPLWRSFQTFHVILFPTYASKYPPAQGIALFLGQLLGHPWIGVLLTAAGMAASFVWMLQAWIPARWALLAGLLAAIKLCVACYWINSYWGGAVAAIGGALVLGALARLKRKPSLREAILFAAGLVILFNSRPYESVFFCLPLGVALLFWLLLNYKGPQSAHYRKFVILPVSALLLIAALAMSFYNWRITGDPLDPPFVFAARFNNRAAIFLWQSPKPPIHFDVAELDQFYNRAELERYNRTWQALLSVFQEKMQSCAAVFAWPAAWLLLPGAFFLFRDRRPRLVYFALFATLFGYSLVVWPWPHYLAPAACAWFALLVQCIRHLRAFRPFGRPVGPALSRVIFLALVLDVSHLAAQRISDPQGWGGWGLLDREQLKDTLEATPGKHVVLVRYGPDHSVHEEWVFNGADVDTSKIIWARDLPGPVNDRLLAYYPDRTIWLVIPETGDVSILRPPVAQRPLGRKAADLHAP